MREPLNGRDRHDMTVPAQTRDARRAGAARRPLPTGTAPARSAGRFAALRAFGGGFGRLLLQRPGEILGSLVALGAVAAVAVNALGFQGGRHPAPIFPHVAVRPAEAPERKPAPVRMVETTPPVAAKPQAEPVAQDPIAEIIKAGAATASATPVASDVAQAQRALVKLGYGPLKADGLMGAGTRAAIERFERDRKLPVRGQASGRTLRELAARTASPPG